MNSYITPKRYFIGYLLLTFLLILDLWLLIKFGLSLAGYWSDRILFWAWFLGTYGFIVIFWKRKIVKAYFGILILGIILSILPMGIFFFGIILSTTGKGLYYKEQISDKYRLQVTNYSIMGVPKFEIIENKGLFEKSITGRHSQFVVNDSTYIECENVKKAKFISQNETSILLYIQADTLSFNAEVKKMKTKK